MNRVKAFAVAAWAAITDWSDAVEIGREMRNCPECVPGQDEYCVEHMEMVEGWVDS